MPDRFMSVRRISSQNQPNLTVASRGTHNLDCINVEFPARFSDLLPSRRIPREPERKLGVNV
ncbi:hypothetical protein [Hyphomicrobium denitrificans]|uniref:hypothetical protein n=1 Tax=Hyphomicrobium denitrificans TaxID=53399 RepID=UPI0011818984|nr:hypothetical protein [Hyphomicrobium denitrificans]